MRFASLSKITDIVVPVTNSMPGPAEGGLVADRLEEVTYPSGRVEKYLPGTTGPR